MDDKIQKAFDFASETTKQLITIASAILAVTVTFAKDMLNERTIHAAWALQFSWALYLISILFGIWTLMALTGSLEPNTEDSGKPTIRKKNVTIPSCLQILVFLIAVLLSVIYGWQYVSSEVERFSC